MPTDAPCPHACDGLHCLHPIAPEYLRRRCCHCYEEIDIDESED